MLTRLDLRGVTGALARHLPRPASREELPTAAVREILDQVRRRGDAALVELTERLDGPRLDTIAVSAETMHQALEDLDPALREHLEDAAGAIAAFHRHQMAPVADFECQGLSVRCLRRPVSRAGCYVPGGRASYPSTVLMTAVPARVAGVAEVVACVPPRPDGSLPPSTLAAAAIAGVDELYRIGGAQAVGAMAYGTESVRPVDVIVGPGNLYVSVAMREVAGVVGVPPSFAGPSEVVVVADSDTPAELAAIDLIVQAEHGPHGLAWLVTWSEAAAAAVTAALSRLAASSSRRAEIEATLAEGGWAVLVDGPVQAMEVSNAIAPEHLQLMSADPEALLPLVQNAGAVFCGPGAPASIGDYVAGPSHVLPTNRSARFASALGVEDFLKRIHVVSLEPAALRRLGPAAAAIAEAEGLFAHAESLHLRGATSASGVSMVGG